MSDFNIFEWAASVNPKTNGDKHNGGTAGAQTTYIGGGINPTYTKAAYDAEINQMLAAQPGSRNHALNTACFNLGRFICSGDVNEAVLRADLTAAARQIGLDDHEIQATINSGLRGAQEKIGASRGAPAPVPAVADAYVLTDSGNTEAGTTPPAATMTPDEIHGIKVTHRAYELRVNEEARLLYAAQRAAELNQKAPDPVNLVDFLSVPDEDATYRIDQLLPVGARALFVAQYKTGKTTSIANLVRALADGNPFLMKFKTTQVTKVTIIDTELDERMLRRWLRKQSIINQDRIQVLSLKGKLSTFDILDASTRAAWAARLAGSDFVILDCLRPCLDALGLSEDKDGGRFTVAWDALMDEAGVQESVVVHHAGHNSERSRGDSRLLDWPDVIWKLVKETQTGDEGSSDLATLHDGGKRFFSAHGRDVNVPECQLHYAPEDGSLRALDGTRGDLKAKTVLPDLVEILGDPANPDGLTMTAIEAKLKACGHSRGLVRKAVGQAIKEGVVVVGQGARNSSLHTLNPSHRAEPAAW